MNTEELIQTIARAYKHPAEGEADQNGNTRLSVLKDRFHLSSLKLQKILVTAGVYQPVRSHASYDEVTRLREQGKSVGEIMEITGLSRASVSACFPYEKAVYNADRMGADISADAERKRKQRNRNDMKKVRAVRQLQYRITDEDFWKAVRKYEEEIFISTDGKKYRTEVRLTLPEDGTGRQALEPDLIVSFNGKESLSFPAEEVLDVLHDALEWKASGNSGDRSALEQKRVYPYVWPLLISFGIIPGDRTKTMARRSFFFPKVCACCGREAVHTVSSFADLVRIDEELSKKERRRWGPAEWEEAEKAERSLGWKSWEEIAKKDNSSIRAFNKEGERYFCTLCAQTIRMALSDGELPQALPPEDLSDLPPEAAQAVFDQYFEKIPKGVRWIDRYRRGYPFETTREENLSCSRLYKEQDKEGVEHTFFCHKEEYPLFMRFEAIEVHRLTKAGKLTARHTDTDYEFSTMRWLEWEDDEAENQRKTCVGFLELANRIRESLQNPTLEWHNPENWVSNAVARGSRQCSLRSIGEMQLVYVDAGMVQGRHWKEGSWGFLIDGILFTGEELARMASNHLGWKLQYRFTDPSEESLREGTYLMPVQIGEKELLTETSELLNLFTADGAFRSIRDRMNFEILFEKTVLKKLKLYHESNPRGYGRLAGMRLIKRLQWIRGTEQLIMRIREMMET